jgi:hypothetical protein
MITLKELLNGKDDSTLDQTIKDNLAELLVRVNKLRKAYGKPMRVTSGLRFMADHLAIYARKGITDMSKIPQKSKHLQGSAVDFADPKGELQAFIKSKTEAELEEFGLWYESFEYTKNWLHVQSVPPKSEKRFFKP